MYNTKNVIDRLRSLKYYFKHMSNFSKNLDINSTDPGFNEIKDYQVSHINYIISRIPSYTWFNNTDSYLKNSDDYININIVPNHNLMSIESSDYIDNSMIPISISDSDKFLYDVDIKGGLSNEYVNNLNEDTKYSLSNIGFYGGQPNNSLRSIYIELPSSIKDSLPIEYIEESIDKKTIVSSTKYIVYK